MALFHFTVTSDRQTLRKILAHQKFILEQLLETKNQITTMANEINAYLDRIETAVGNIRQDIQDIKDGLPDNGGLSAAEVAQIKQRLTTVVDSVEALDAENTRPEVPTDPENPTPEEPQQPA